MICPFFELTPNAPPEENLRKTPNYLIVVISVVILTVCAHGQPPGSNIDTYFSENGQLYIQPLADALGANFNSGWFHDARSASCPSPTSLMLGRVHCAQWNERNIFTNLVDRRSTGCRTTRFHVYMLIFSLCKSAWYFVQFVSCQIPQEKILPRV